MLYEVITRDSDVDISVKKPEETPWYLTIFISWFPMLLLIGVWIFFMRQMQMGGKGGALSFGKTRAKLQGEGEVKITFKDVAGIDEAKEELEEIIDFLRDPQKFTKLGGRIPKGVLLAGSPGVITSYSIHYTKLYDFVRHCTSAWRQSCGQ